MKNTDILDRSLMKLEEQTGAKVKTLDSLNKSLVTISWNSSIPNDKINLDTKKSFVRISYGANEDDFEVHVLNNMSAAAMATNVKKIKNKNTLFVSDYFSGNMADSWINSQINFTDIAGNTHIRTDNLFILIKGNKKPEIIEKQRPKRLFQEVGLKILFILLNDPNIINNTYRQIAQLSKTSPSSVQYIFEELEEMNFLIFPSNSKRKLVQKQKLLERWSIAYGEHLKPKLHRGYFKFKYPLSKQKLKSLLNSSEQIYWGGEFAAEMMTNYLDAHYFTLYSSARFSTLIKELLIIPTKKDKSEFELIEVFWDKDIDAIFNTRKITSPILTYADLYNSLNERNMETAEKILQNDLQYLL